MIDHWFWLIICLICIAWYLFITGYVAVKGYSDIRAMLRRIKGNTNTNGDVETNIERR